MSVQLKIKLFLKAKSPEALQVLMLNRNIKDGMKYLYDVMFANGFWYAWFEGDAEDYLKEEVAKIGLLTTVKNGQRK